MPRTLATLVMTVVIHSASLASDLRISLDNDRGSLSVIREDDGRTLLTQNARSDFRPYIHPIVAPDGKGTLTEFSPGHHKHQTGLYWGFTRVNSRDYFHHPEGDYWKRKSLKVLKDKGSSVQWQTVYDLLDDNGGVVLTETQTWEMRTTGSEYLLDLTWQGTAKTDVTIAEYKYGGLFLRMPWKKGIVGAVVNSSQLRNADAEGKRDVWVDVGMQIEGRDDLAHIAIFDHPKNKGFPHPWRVDGNMGVGPVRARLGNWVIKEGASETIRHRLVVYTGKLNERGLTQKWTAYSGQLEWKKDHTRTTPNDEAESLSLLVHTLNETKDPTIRIAIMRGMLRGLAGRRNVSPPARWAALSARLADSDDTTICDLSRQLSQVFGDEKAAAQAIATANDRSVNTASRRSALRSLLNQQNEEASDLLESLLDDPALVIDAIRGYAIVENATAPSVLLERYHQMNPDQRRAVIETLASRKRYAESLLAAIEGEKVSRDEVPAHVARSLAHILGDRFVKVFGEVQQLAEQRQALMANYKKMLTTDAIAKANVSRGRAVFSKTCASCHLLYGEGAQIGPDLTGSNRANLDYILLNSVDPSYDVADAYKMVQIVTMDGRVISGVIAEEDERRLVLKTVEEPTVVVLKEDIDIRRVSPKSMMPDGQLEQMTHQEVIDLIKYLRTTEQVELAE